MPWQLQPIYPWVNRLRACLTPTLPHGLPRPTVRNVGHTVRSVRPLRCAVRNGWPVSVGRIMATCEWCADLEDHPAEAAVRVESGDVWTACLTGVGEILAAHGDQECAVWPMVGAA